MSFKLHETEDAFQMLEWLVKTNTSYPMDAAWHDALHNAQDEYRRLLEHCIHQRDELAKWHRRYEEEAFDWQADMERSMADGRGCPHRDEHSATCMIDYTECDGCEGEKMDGTEAGRVDEGVGRTMKEQGSGITDELRMKLARRLAGWKMAREEYDEYIAIADRIDARVSEMLADLTAGMEPMTEESMEREGWMRLPVDMDGVPIRPGDRLEEGEVMAVAPDAVVYESGDASWDEPCMCRHQPDSWERIIGDAADYGGSRQFVGTTGDRARLAELVERCMRLAGDADA